MEKRRATLTKDLNIACCLLPQMTAVPTLRVQDFSCVGTSNCRLKTSLLPTAYCLLPQTQTAGWSLRT